MHDGVTILWNYSNMTETHYRLLNNIARRGFVHVELVWMTFNWADDNAFIIPSVYPFYWNVPVISFHLWSLSVDQYFITFVENWEFGFSDDWWSF